MTKKEFIDRIKDIPDDAKIEILDLNGWGETLDIQDIDGYNKQDNVIIIIPIFKDYNNDNLEDYD